MAIPNSVKNPNNPNIKFEGRESVLHDSMRPTMAVRPTEAERMDSEVRFENRAETTFVKAIRRDTLTQKNTVVTTVAPVNGHPVYTMRIMNDNSIVSEVQHQFAAFRNIYAQLNEEKYCDKMLTAPFPATLRRSSLGLKLNDDMIEVRRSELNTVSFAHKQIDDYNNMHIVSINLHSGGSICWIILMS